jgi:DNA (cytosine-5)-methyltransferase 1
MHWFTKASRAKTKDDYETWVEGGVTPTLNAFENNGDVRATVLVYTPSSFGNYREGVGTLRADGGDLGGGSESVIVFHPHRSDGVRLQGDTVNTLTSYMGTGGLNTPMVHAIQNTVIGRSDTAGPNGRGHTDEGEPMFTIDTTSPHAIVIREREGKPGGGKGAMFSEKSFTLKGVNDQTIFSQTIRRLTPLECERLQGFPDGWTDEQSDSQRYKQMGNAVTVNVAKWIGDRIVDSYGK